MQHYEAVLAEHYDWMCGGFEAGKERGACFFHEHGLAGLGKKALDLGCGSGFQTIALAEKGMGVVAVDNSRRMLAKLEDRIAGQEYQYNVVTLCADMCDVASWAGGTASKPFDLIVCMGDSLAHLPDMDTVRVLLGNIRDHLASGGSLALQFRDQTHEPTGVDRIVPLRMQSDRLMTTVLEYGPHTVTVNDVVYNFVGNQWRVTKGSYVKTRLRMGEVVDCLELLGLTRTYSNIHNGLACLVYCKA